MVKQILFIFSLILLIQSSNAQKWDTLYGSPYYKEGLSDLIEYYDKGYLIYGFRDFPYYDNWLIKTDINGGMIWDKIIFHNNDQTNARTIDQNSSGNIIGAGAIWFDNENWPYLIKLDACGNKIYCRVYIDDFYEWGVFNDAIFFDNGDVLALCQLSHYYNAYDEIFLYYINSEGDILWKKPYASKQDYPLMITHSAKKLYKIKDGYMIVGDTHYAYPWNPTVGKIRPLFIRLDEEFKELWILPFGVSSNLVSWGLDGLVQYNDSTYIGLGQGNYSSILDFFNDDGEELSYKYIKNEDIGPDVGFSAIGSITLLDENKFIASAGFGLNNNTTSRGELIMDISGHICGVASHPNTRGRTKLIITFDNKYTVGCTYEKPYTINDRDIYLYKLNDSLQHDTVYPGNYTYDSLCPYQIQSGEIDISDCLLFTDVEEVPTPEVYFESLNTVSIKAYPNPVDEGKVTFEYINMEYLFGSPPSTPPDGGNYQTLQIFNLFGQKVHEERIYKYQGESKVDVSGWGKGMYVGIVVSEGKPLSRCKFVVH